MTSEVFFTTGCNKGPDWGLFMHCCLAPSLLIFFILSFFGKRYNYRLRALFGISKLAVVFPINLLDDHEHRWSHAMAFGAAASIIFELFSGDYTSLYLKDTDNVETWLKIFLGAVATFELGTVLFPFFACITSPSLFVGSLLGFMYVTVWFSVMLAHIITCPNIDGLGFPYESVVIQLPVLVFTFLLMLRFLYYLVISVLKRMQASKPTSEEKLMKTYQAQHVRALLRPPPPPKIYSTRWENMLYSWYEPTQNFVYPTRIICTFTVAVLCQYQVAIKITYGLDQGLICVFSKINEWYAVYALTYDIPENEANATYQAIDRYETAAHVSWYLSCVVSILLSVSYIGHIFVCFRKHVLRMARGDRKFLPDVGLTSTKSMTGSLQYCGFQIAYYLSGYVVMMVISFLLIYVISGAIVIPLMVDAKAFIIGFCNVVVPLLAVAFLVFGSQPILARRVFLQPKLNQNDKDKPLALQHRDFYHTFSYFLVFLNVLVGVLACVVRILTGLIVGVFLLCRIDRPILMRGYEHLDQSYQAYIGNLNMINAHSHPVLVVFCQLLVNRIIVRKKARLGRHRSAPTDETTASYEFVEHEIGGPNSKAKSYAVIGYGSTNNSTRSKSISPHARAVMRWHLAYTLLFNPTLLHTRKRSRQITYEEMEKKILKAATLLPHRQQVLQRTKAAAAVAASKVGVVAGGRIRSSQGVFLDQREPDDVLAAELLNRELREDRSEDEDEILNDVDEAEDVGAVDDRGSDDGVGRSDSRPAYENVDLSKEETFARLHESEDEKVDNDHTTIHVSNELEAEGDVRRRTTVPTQQRDGTDEVNNGSNHNPHERDVPRPADPENNEALPNRSTEPTQVVIHLDTPSHSSTDDPDMNR